MAAPRPRAVVFDVIETLFSLAAVDETLTRVDCGPGALTTFFAGVLRDAFALGATGGYHPFREVADASLATSLVSLDADQRAEVLDSFTTLDAHPDVAPALELLVRAEVPVGALTNGSSEVTRTLLDRSGLTDHIGPVISVDDVGVWKPRPEPYRHAAEVMSVAPDELALVAVHPWDVHGAAAAGLRTGWVARTPGPFPPVFTTPDVQGPDLVAVVDALLGLPA